MSFFESLHTGDEVKLKENCLKHVRTRAWIFLEKDEKDDTAVVSHKSGNFCMHVKEEDVDWDAYPKIKELFSKIKNGSR
jgi:hypothetical protein